MSDLPTSNDAVACFNAAINFAIDVCDRSDAVDFLRQWREGDWPSLDVDWPEFRGPVPSATCGSAKSVNVDGLANEIRRVDGSHSLGAGELAEALAGYLNSGAS